MFHIHISGSGCGRYWEGKMREKNPKGSELMGEWFGNYISKIKLFLLFVQ